MLKFQKKYLIHVAIFLVALLLLSALIVPVRSVVLNILKQPLKLFSFLHREINGMIFFHRNMVQNERSAREINLLKNRLNGLNEASLEKERLERLLNLKQKSPYRVFAARVIGRSADSWSSSVIVDKGSINGIRRGMAVINYLGLAGRVVETESSTSKVLLLNDPNFSISALDQRSRQEGLVSGTLGSSLVMRYLPEGSDIKVNDQVISSGLNGIYPKGLIIGTIISTADEFSGLSSFAIIKPAVNLNNLEELLIIAE